LVADYLKQHQIKVIIGPTLGSKSKYELRNKTFKAAALLKEAGVEFAIMTDHPVIHLANALTQVAIFVREGLNELDAFKAVTIDAARINGVDHRVGSIKPLKDADIVIWNGHPFHYMTKPDVVIVDGKIVHQA
jgi:imidazolonepropionase-like amidohydrolase